MYFPYVYGRRSELLAVRNVSPKYLVSGKVIPVIEPVVVKPADLIKCIEEVGQRQQRAIVIMNPSQGEFKGKAASPWATSIDAAAAKFQTIIPGFLCRPGTTPSDISTFFAKYPHREVALLYLNSGLPDATVGSLAAVPNVSYHIVLQGKMPATQLSMLPPSKTIHIADHFNKQLRHKSFSTHGIGFGDYTITGSEVQLGGGQPGAVAVHITYKSAADGNIWVQHFVSNDTEIGVGTTDAKFLQAISKFVTDYHLRKSEFGANPAINAYLTNHSNSHFPGLGKNKELQIHHHIARIHDFLSTGQ
jgi:hypothetical protein